MDHIALRMPVFIYIVSIDFDKLLQDGSFATGALDRESCRIMKMTIHLSSVFIVRILWSEDCRTHTTGEMLDVKLHICEDEGR